DADLRLPRLWRGLDLAVRARKRASRAAAGRRRVLGAAARSAIHLVRSEALAVEADHGGFRSDRRGPSARHTGLGTGYPAKGWPSASGCGTSLLHVAIPRI